eukprot:3693198-Prymnesium_polylepis.1
MAGPPLPLSPPPPPPPPPSTPLPPPPRSQQATRAAIDALRPALTLEQIKRVLRDHGISHVVSPAVGGRAARTK